ncbi:MAG: hypothetical protein ACRBF0_15250 [Calditrichia bacterium]
MKLQSEIPDHSVIQGYIESRLSDIEAHELEKLRVKSGEIKWLLEVIDQLKTAHIAIEDTPSRITPPISLRELDNLLLELYSGSISEKRRLFFLAGIFQSPITLDKLWIKCSQLATMDGVEYKAEPAKSLRWPLSAVSSVIALLPVAALTYLLFILPPTISEVKFAPKEYSFASNVPYSSAEDIFLGKLHPEKEKDFKKLERNYDIAISMYSTFKYDEADRLFSSTVSLIPEPAKTDASLSKKKLYRNYLFYLGLSQMASSQKYEYRSAKAVIILESALAHLQEAVRYLHPKDNTPLEREYFFQGMVLIFMDKRTEALKPLKKIQDDAPFYEEKVALLRNIPE